MPKTNQKRTKQLSVWLTLKEYKKLSQTHNRYRLKEGHAVSMSEFVRTLIEDYQKAEKIKLEAPVSE